MLCHVSFLTYHMGPIRGEMHSGVLMKLRLWPICFDFGRFHVACLSPPLAAVPFEDWFCQECASDNSHLSDSFSRDESEIAEAEVMDLLYEVVPTSSRLRLSTTAQRTVSVRTRKSERVRQQSSRTHTTLCQVILFLWEMYSFLSWGILVILMLGSLYDYHYNWFTELVIFYSKCINIFGCLFSRMSPDTFWNQVGLKLKMPWQAILY